MLSKQETTILKSPTCEPNKCTATPLSMNPDKLPIDEHVPHKVCMCEASSGFSRLFIATNASMVTSAMAPDADAPTNIANAVAASNFPPSAKTRYTVIVIRPTRPQNGNPVRDCWENLCCQQRKLPSRQQKVDYRDFEVMCKDLQE